MMPSGPYRKKFSCKSSKEQGFFFGPFFKKWHVSVFSSFTDFYTCYAHYSPCSFNIAEVESRAGKPALPRRSDVADCNGKEKDYESGFHYYGARYYWSELLTGWLSVDALIDSIPQISSYAYCFGNPVKLIEPDGNFPIETICDIAVLVYDVGAAVANHLQGDHTQATSHWADAAMDGFAALTPYVPAGASMLVRGAKSTAKVFDASKLKYVKLSNGKWSPNKYRQNLQKYTGKEGIGCHAHLTLPKDQELKKIFDAAGLDVNDPANMVW